MSPIIIIFTIFFLVVDSYAYWGYGAYGGMGICPVELSENSSEDFELKKELQQIRQAAEGSTQRLNRYEEALATIDHLGDITAEHMRTQRLCSGAYIRQSQKKCSENDLEDCGKVGVPDEQFELWSQVCLPQGRVKEEICRLSQDPLCTEAIKKYLPLHESVSQLADRETGILEKIGGNQENETEAFCPSCFLEGSSKPRQEVVALPISTSQPPPGPSWQSYGYPYMANCHYGSLSGELKNGGFLCGRSLSSSQGKGENTIFAGGLPFGQSNDPCLETRGKEEGEGLEGIEGSSQRSSF